MDIDEKLQRFRKSNAHLVANSSASSRSSPSFSLVDLLSYFKRAQKETPSATSVNSPDVTSTKSTSNLNNITSVSSSAATAAAAAANKTKTRVEDDLTHRRLHKSPKAKDGATTAHKHRRRMDSRDDDNDADDEIEAQQAIMFTEEEKNEIAKANARTWRLYLIRLSLKVALWAVLWAIFIRIEFGAVYFVVSLLVIICLNTRTGAKHRNRQRGTHGLSAYSVFNPNLERLPGQITSEQLERNLVQMF